jgi:hypothetical protein
MILILITPYIFPMLERIENQTERIMRVERARKVE